MAAAKSAPICAATRASTTSTSRAPTARTISSCGARPAPSETRKAPQNDPVLKKSITSELGNVSPVMIVPGDYTEEELWFQARNVATMVVNNASFNCNAAKMLVTAARMGQGARAFSSW